MRDQAEELRMKMLKTQGKLAKSIAVVSGKGGVGKSNFTTNFAYALIAKGKKVLIIDMDIGMGNIHILLGLIPPHSLRDYLTTEQPLEAIINEAPEGLDFIAGGSGLDTVMEWSESMFDALMNAFEQLQKQYDFILFDMGAGATQSVIDLVVAVDEVIVISTTEPTSITDAYSMMKFIYKKDPDKQFHIVSNRIAKKDDGNDAATRLQFAMKKFLMKDVSLLGFLPEDQHVHKAVVAQSPYFLLFPKAQVTQRMESIAEQFVFTDITEEVSTSNFLSKLKSIFGRGRG